MPLTRAFQNIYTPHTTLNNNPNKMEKESGYTTTFLVDQTPEEVFNAIKNVSKWWQGEIKGNSKQQDEEFEYRMLDIHFSKQKVIEIVPNKRVVWLVTDSNLSSFKDKKE